MSGYIGNGPRYGRGQRFTFVAAGGETSVSGLDLLGLTLNYEPGFELVFVNGSFLPRTEYVATTGSAISGLDALSALDVVDIISMGVMLGEDTIRLTQNGADILNKNAFSDNIGAYRKGTIVGTVSQSGGIPTGNIIERGTGFIRYADGTQICYGVVDAGSRTIDNPFAGGFRSTGVVWTYPKAFGANPIVHITATNLSALGAAIATVTTTSTTFVLTSATSQSGASRTVALIAIGSWF